MANKGWIIPDDWDGVSYQNYMFCAPCSPKWEGVVRGALWNLGRARNYDGDTGDFREARDIGKEIYFSMANCNDGFNAIAEAMLEIAGAMRTNTTDCGCPGGTGTEYDGAPSSEPTQFGPGEQYPTEQAYLDDKCLMANVMWRDYRALLVELDGFDVDTLTSGLVSAGAGIIATAALALFATGPIAVTIGAVTGLLSLMAGSTLFSLGDMIAAMDTLKDDLVCALYSAENATVAKSDFEAALDGAGLSFVESAVVSLMGVTNFYNQLFDIPAGLDQQSVSSPVDCSNCPGPVGVFYQIDNDGNESGNGDIFTDGSPMSISSQFDSVQGFHYIRLGVYGENLNRTSNYATDCTALPPGVLGTNEASFEFVMTSLVRNPNNGTLGTECDAGNWGIAFDSSIVQGQTYITTWIEYISSNPFTLGCTIVWPKP